MANESKNNKTMINQKSFVKNIIEYILTANNPITGIKDFDKEKRIFLNYWKALADLLDDGNNSYSSSIMVSHYFVSFPYLSS